MKRKIAINTHFILFLVILIVFINCAILFFINSKNGDMFSALVISIPLIIMIFVVLISPVVYIFEDDKLTIIYCIGIKEFIEWKEIQSITRCVGWFIGKSKSTDRGLPIYAIDYQRRKKLPFFLKAHISNNTKTSKLLKEYYKNNFHEYWN